MSAAAASRPRGWYLAWSIALAPMLLLAIGWGHELSPTRSLARSYALPIVAVELAIAIVALVETRRFPRLPRFPAALLLLLVAVVFFSAARAPDPATSLFMTLLWVNHLLFGFGIYQLARHGLLTAPQISRAMPIAFAWFGAVLIAYYALHSEHGHNWYQDSPSFNNIRWLGYYCAAIFGLCAGGWLESRRVGLAIAIFALALALWTGSRGSLAAVIGGYVVAVLFVPVAAKATPRFLGAVLLSILLALAVSQVWPLDQGSAERLLFDQADSGRMEVWRQTASLIGQRPWLGWGEAQFSTLLQSRFAQPHNIVLQILLAWGAVGFGLIAVLAALLADRVRRNANRQNAPLIFAICNIAAFSLIDGSLFHIHSVSVFALCAALLAAGEGSATEMR